MDTIEDVVRSYVPFTHGVSSKGWHSVYCEVCGDGARTKGPRGGWLFEGDACFYSCFNCGIKTNYDPNREHPMSKGMYDVFQAFGVPSSEYKTLELKANPERKLKRKKKVKLPSIDLPDYFRPIKEYPEDDPLAEAAREFLWDNYKITQDDYPFFLVTGKTTSKKKDDQYLCRYLRPRIIIPAYNRSNLIHWQARIFVGEHERKYVSASIDDSSGAMFGMDNINSNFDRPLYITEGFFDSWHVHGVAIAKNAMTSSQIEILERSNRQLVVIPDYNKDGLNLAKQATERGWGVSLPDLQEAVDICDAVNRYGKLFVLKSIVDRTYHGDAAKFQVFSEAHKFK